jgi:hypothetical protein
MAQNKEYQCVFNQHFNCNYSSPCRGCVNFAPDAAVNKNTSHNKQSVPCSNCGDGKFLRTGETCLWCWRVYK